MLYTTPQISNDRHSTYEAGSGVSYRELIDRLRTADLLHLEDLAVVEQPKSWVLEQFYTVINDCYADERSVMFTADVDPPRRRPSAEKWRSESGSAGIGCHLAEAARRLSPVAAAPKATSPSAAAA